MTTDQSSGPSPGQICSMAMSLLKRNAVASLDDTTVEASACNVWYPILRDQLLELYAWTFAVKRVQLQQAAASPVYQYCYEYPLPADCLMPLEARAGIVGMDNTDPVTIEQEFTWIVEGGSIITDAEVVFLKYSARLDESGMFTPSFSLSLAYRIAGTLAYSMTGNDKLAAMLLSASDSEARRAEARDARKGTEEPFPQQDSWVANRNATFLYRQGGWLRQGQTE